MGIGSCPTPEGELAEAAAWMGSSCGSGVVPPASGPAPTPELWVVMVMIRYWSTTPRVRSCGLMLILTPVAYERG